MVSALVRRSSSFSGLDRRKLPDGGPEKAAGTTPAPTGPENATGSENVRVALPIIPAMSARTPFFVLAAVTIVLVVAFELATLAFLRNAANVDSAPGLGGPYLALLDGILLYLMLLMSIQYLPFKALTARVSSVVTLILSLLGIVGTLWLILLAFSMLLLMLGL